MATCVVTGANRGIGLELCRQLAERGDSVIGACRKSSPELDALSVEVIENVDVADPGSVSALAEKIGERKVDLVINNAGILRRMSLHELDAAGIEGILSQIRVNSIGPLIVSKALLPRLENGAKIAIITSRMGSVADNTSGSHYGYRMSKAAVNIAGKSLAVDLHDRGIAVALIHPGWVRTDMTSNQGLVDTDEAVRGILARIDELDLESSGGFWHSNGESLPW